VDNSAAFHRSFWRIFGSRRTEKTVVFLAAIFTFTGEDSRQQRKSLHGMGLGEMFDFSNSQFRMKGKEGQE
jgi:hypothetical protein